MILTINSISSLEEAIKYLKSLDFKEPYICEIKTGDKVKTTQQCKLFHSLLQEFVKELVATHRNLSDIEKTIDYWKYNIKVLAGFYDTKKGLIFPPEIAVKVDNYLKTLPEDIQTEIYEKIYIKVRSISTATTKELSNLIEVLLIKITDSIPREHIINNEFIFQFLSETYNKISSLPDLTKMTSNQSTIYNYYQNMIIDDMHPVDIHQIIFTYCYENKIQKSEDELLEIKEKIENACRKNNWKTKSGRVITDVDIVKLIEKHGLL